MRLRGRQEVLGWQQARYGGHKVVEYMSRHLEGVTGLQCLTPMMIHADFHKL